MKKSCVQSPGDSAGSRRPQPDEAANQQAQAFLASLIAPISLERFAEEYWERQLLHATSPAPSHLYHFGFRDLEAAIRFSPATFDKAFRMVFHHIDVPKPEIQNAPGDMNFIKMQKLFQGGCSIVANYTYRYSLRLQRLKSRLEHCIGGHVNINLYATPRLAQGFKIHYDNHCVLITQVEGAKEWKLFEQAAECPCNDVEETPRPPFSPKATPQHHFILKTGERFYLPRGLVHVANGLSGQDSLHLTIGLHPPLWHAEVKALLDQALKDQTSLRRSLPLPISGAKRKQKFREQSQSLLQELYQRLDPDIRHYRAPAETENIRAWPVADEAIPDLEAVQSLQANVRLQLRPDVEFKAKEEFFCLNQPQRSFPLPLKPRCLPAWEFMRTAGTFQSQDLQAYLPEEEHLLWSQYMLENGLVRFA